MVQYNIVANSKLDSLTGPGEGNISLTYNELLSLYNGNTNDTTVHLNSSDVLYLEIDFGYRIKLDSFNAYILPTTSGLESNLGFYYRNQRLDFYTKLSNAFNGTFHYATNLPTIFAPSSLLLTISGIDCYLSEVVTNNEDYSVSFGEDGNQTQIYLNDSNSSNYSDAHILKVKNTSSVESATAYVCVDYSGSPGDFYVKISAEDKYYLGLEDGMCITNDYNYSRYRWSYGYLDNIKIVNSDYITIDVTSNLGSVGKYTTPIFHMEAESDYTYLGYHPYIFNRFDSSFVVVTTTGIVPNTSIKVDELDDDYTIEVRSSNIDPLDYTRIFHVKARRLTYAVNTYDLYEKDPYIDQENLFASSFFNFASGNTVSFVIDCVVDDRTGNVACIVGYYNAFHGMPHINFSQYAFMCDYKGNVINGSTRFSGEHTYPSHLSLCEFSPESDLWFFNHHVNKLYCLSLLFTVIVTIEDVHSFSVSLKKHENCVWVIYHSVNPGVHLVSGNNIVRSSIIEYSASLVAGNYDGGCWIFETSKNSLLRYSPEYNDEGELIYSKVVNIPYISYSPDAVTSMVNDKTGKDGLWVINGRSVFHYNKYGELITTTNLTFGGDSLKATSLGVLVRKHEGHLYAFLDINGNLVKQGSTDSPQCLKILTFKNAVSSNTNDLLPLSYDPVWGSSGSLKWKKVCLSGYFLPKTKYHQVRITLRSEQINMSPSVTSVVIPKPVTLSDIPKNGTKPLYIKTFFNGNEDSIEYNTKLRCWWYIQD